jgi:hypothetical protein
MRVEVGMQGSCGRNLLCLENSGGIVDLEFEIGWQNPAKKSSRKILPDNLANKSRARIYLR